MIEKEKVVGILGGMGPFATLEFFRLILQNTSAKKDWEHIRVIIDSNVKIPSRTRAVLYGETNPAPFMIESINNLAKINVDFVVVPCNSAHYFYDQVAPEITVPWLNIIEVTSKKIHRKNFRTPLVIGGYVTTEKKLYNKYNDHVVYLNDDDRRFSETIIEEIKLTSKISKKTKNKFSYILNNYKNEFDCIILACTEYALIIDELSELDIPIIDSTTEYVKEIIKIVKGNNVFQTNIKS